MNTKSSGAPHHGNAAKVVATTGSKYTTLSDNHGALLADAAQSYLDIFWLEQGIKEIASRGVTFCADQVQEEFGLPDLGNATGGVFMRLHRAGVIKRVGYRPSNKASRAGGVVAIWAAGDQL